MLGLNMLLGLAAGVLPAHVPPPPPVAPAVVVPAPVQAAPVVQMVPVIPAPAPVVTSAPATTPSVTPTTVPSVTVSTTMYVVTYIDTTPNAQGEVNYLPITAAVPSLAECQGIVADAATTVVSPCAAQSNQETTDPGTLANQ